MFRYRKLIPAVGALAVVLGISYLVAGGSSQSAPIIRKSTQPSAGSVKTVMVAEGNGGAVFGMPKTMAMPETEAEITSQLASLDLDLPQTSVPDQIFIQDTPFGDCATSMELSRQETALVSLTLSASCHQNAEFVIWHDAIAFSGRTNDNGRARVNVPALVENATFVATFNNIEVARETLHVPEVANHDRAALRWRGEHSLQLHALEFGAAFGEHGHVWSASVGDTALARDGRQGYIARLGLTNVTTPYWAEIYTFPAGARNADGHIELKVGAAVTDANCGRKLTAETLETNSGQMVISREIDIQLPACGLERPTIIHTDLFPTRQATTN